MVAGVAVLPTLILIGEAPTELEKAIARYRMEVDALNSSKNLTDEEIDAGIDKADAILVKAVKLPVTNDQQLAHSQRFRVRGSSAFYLLGFSRRHFSQNGYQDTSSPGCYS
jgi:hypothetical protein